MNAQQFDYVVVGGGSAGCAVAARLSEDPNVTVCLLEAGGSDKSVLVHAPAGVVAMVPTKINNWAYQTLPQKGLNGRRGYQPRGKVLGGSSSINAMLYVRGNRWDYDHWASLGNAGWSYDEVLPLLQARREQRDARCQRLSRRWRPAQRGRAAQPQPAEQKFPRRRSAERRAAQPRLQRRRAVRRLHVPGDAPERRALQRGQGLHHAEPVAAQPGAEAERAECANPVRRQACGRCGLPPGQRAARGARAPRGHRLQRRLRLAAAADAVGHRRRGRTAAPGHGRGAATCRVSARTCRTTSTMCRPGARAATPTPSACRRVAP